MPRLALDQLRQYDHLAWSWRWWNDGQFQHFSGLCVVLRRLLGGWRRAFARSRQDAPQDG